LHPDWEDVEVKFEDAVFQVYQKSSQKECLTKVTSYSDFCKDLGDLWDFCGDGPANTFCYKRLKMLEKKFELHNLMNADIEREGLKNDPKDFFNVYKADNHLHAAAMMTGPHLLQFIKRKLREEGDAEALPATDTQKSYTLRELITEQLGLDEDNLTIDSLAVQGDETVFCRFDNFNAHYNPFGNSALRSYFLKTPSKYFAEILREVIDRNLEQGTNVLLEPRLSIYGKSPSEWDELAEWMVGLDQDPRTSLFHDGSVRWMIQFPRIFRFMVGRGVADFGEYTSNLFRPLFEVTLDPSSHPALAAFLEHVVGFDSVDDESPFDELCQPAPAAAEGGAAGTTSKRLPYSWFLYHAWANLHALNQLRCARGRRPFAWRPHAGEAGQVHHMATTFLLADSINHGIMCDKRKVLTYLYYLAQVGMSVSPLSNNALFLPLVQNPFPKFHAYGMNVTLSTDDPLQFHNTNQPMVEEYTIARQVYGLSNSDLAEIAFRSVLQSGWPHARKQEMLGPHYLLHGVQGNTVGKTNIPDCRASYRYNNLLDEYRNVWNASHRLERSNNEVGGDGLPMPPPAAAPSERPAADASQEAAAPGAAARADWMRVLARLRAATLWRADRDHNLDGALPTHLTFRAGDVVVVFPWSIEGDPPLSAGALARGASAVPPPAPPAAAAAAADDLVEGGYVPSAELDFGGEFWYGRDRHNREGVFPASYGKLVQHGKHLHYPNVLQYL